MYDVARACVNSIAKGSSIAACAEEWAPCQVSNWQHPCSKCQNVKCNGKNDGQPALADRWPLAVRTRASGTDSTVCENRGHHGRRAVCRVGVTDSGISESLTGRAYQNLNLRAPAGRFDPGPVCRAAGVVVRLSALSAPAVPRSGGGSATE
jgi:hypothetical protein